MVQTPLRGLQRVSSCWGTLLLGVRETNATPGGVSPRVGAPGASASCSRTVHSSTDWRSTKRSPSHYDVLKISPAATQDQVKKAYYKMSREHHPDLHGGSAEASEKFRNISEAYEVLGDPLKRSDYDAIYGVYTPSSSDYEAPEQETIFSRRSRRPNRSQFNTEAWEDAHYGRAEERTQPPDWRRLNNPHRWRSAHGPRASPYDAERFWDEEMARRYGGKQATEQQRKIMEERMKELRHFHRTAMIILMFFFVVGSLVNVHFDDRPNGYRPRSNPQVDKGRRD